jgi:hypothetical protein
MHQRATQMRNPSNTDLSLATNWTLYTSIRCVQRARIIDEFPCPHVGCSAMRVGVPRIVAMAGANGQQLGQIELHPFEVGPLCD